MESFYTELKNATIMPAYTKIKSCKRRKTQKLSNCTNSSLEMQHVEYGKNGKKVSDQHVAYVNKIAFYSQADHPRMRAFSYAWSLPVT